jgi:ribosomal protein S17
MMDQLYDIGDNISNETLRPLTKSERTKLLQILKKIT